MNMRGDQGDQVARQVNPEQESFDLPTTLGMGVGIAAGALAP